MKNHNKLIKKQTELKVRELCEIIEEKDKLIIGLDTKVKRLENLIDRLTGKNNETKT